MNGRRCWVGIGCLVGLALLLSGCALFNSPPVANFSWSPFEPLARSDVSFMDSSTDSGGLFGGGGIVSWSWDFGDSGSSSAQNPKHSFDKSGTYQVRLTVSDGSETATITKSVTVTPSVAGRWRGSIIDGTGFVNDIELVFTHSASGGIQGTAYMLGAQLNCSSISFDPSAKRIQFQLQDLGIWLDGTMDAAENRFQGTWYVLGAPFTPGLTWDVSR